MKKYLSELIGTFVLTFLGCGTAVSLNCGTDTASVVGTAMAFGLLFATILTLLVLPAMYASVYLKKE